MSTAKDYVGRTSDMLAFHGATPGRSVELEQALALAGTGGSIVTGIEKLAQKFLVALLTVLGSKLYKPLDGCNFIRDAKTGQWRTVADIQQSFYSAAVDVKRQLQLDEADATPFDERYANAVLESVALSGDEASMTVVLTSAAGTSRAFIAPLPVLIH